MTKLSIVTISFNNCKELERTINSLIDQNYADCEYIIIDGGSRDGTVDVLKKYQDYITFWVSEPDSGIYNAMNKGLSHCTGEWVFFLNSGDVFHSNNVLKSVDFDSATDEIGAIYGRYMYYSRYDELLLNNVETPFFKSKALCKGMGFSHQSVFVRTKLAKQFPFDETFKLCADYNMMMKIHQAGYQFMHDETIIAICDGRGGASYNNRFIQDKEIARVCGCEFNASLVIKRNFRRFVRPFYRTAMKWMKCNKRRRTV